MDGHSMKSVFGNNGKNYTLHDLKNGLLIRLQQTDFCTRTSRPFPSYNIVSDRRGKRTAWSCTVSVSNGIPTSHIVLAPAIELGECDNDRRRSPALLSTCTKGVPTYHFVNQYI